MDASQSRCTVTGQAWLWIAGEEIPKALADARGSLATAILAIDQRTLCHKSFAFACSGFWVGALASLLCDGAKAP
jgi:hypothetical protein